MLIACATSPSGIKVSVTNGFMAEGPAQAGAVDITAFSGPYNLGGGSFSVVGQASLTTIDCGVLVYRGGPAVKIVPNVNVAKSATALQCNASLPQAHSTFVFSDMQLGPAPMGWVTRVSAGPNTLTADRLTNDVSSFQIAAGVHGACAMFTLPP
jgi:hypothetical protein